MAGTTLPEIDLLFRTNDKDLNRLLYENFAILRTILQLEALHVFGASGEPTLQNSWVASGETNEEIPGFKMDWNRNLYLQGHIINGTVADGTLLFTLPVGYRPNKLVRLVCQSQGSGHGGAGATWNMHIAPNGQVTVQGISGSGYHLQLTTIVNLNN